MSYSKRTYANTGETVTYEDMNRIEQGIYDNDAEIANMKDPTKEGSLANKINVLSEKTTFLCTASTGYTITRQKCYVKNGIAYYHLVVKKTDNTKLSANTQHIVATTLAQYTNDDTAFSLSGNNGVTWNCIGSAGITGTSILAYIGANEQSVINITGTVVLAQ